MGGRARAGGRRHLEEDSDFGTREDSLIKRCAETGLMPREGGAYPSLEEFKPKPYDLCPGTDYKTPTATSKASFFQGLQNLATSAASSLRGRDWLQVSPLGTESWFCQLPFSPALIRPLPKTSQLCTRAWTQGAGTVISLPHSDGRSPLLPTSAHLSINSHTDGKMKRGLATS